MMNQLQELWRAHQAARSEFERQEATKLSLVERIRAALDPAPASDDATPVSSRAA